MENIEQKIVEFENRISNLESKAVASFLSADNFVKRNAELFLAGGIALGWLIGHFWR